MKPLDLIRSSSTVKAGIIIIVLLSIFKFFIIPFNNWKQDSLDQIFLLKKNIAAKEKALTRASDIDASIQDVTASMKQSLSMVWLDISDAGEILLKAQKSLEKKAEKSNVKIQSVQWGEPLGGKIIKAPLTVKLSALPSDLLAFIAEIESDEKFYSVDNMRLISHSGKSQIQGNMTISAYGVK